MLGPDQEIRIKDILEFLLILRSGHTPFMNQTSLFEVDTKQAKLNQLPKDGSVYYQSAFMDVESSAQFMHHLQHSIPWEADQLILFGKKITTRRKVAWVGDPQCTYTYSGVKKEPRAWTSKLLVIKDRMEELAQAEFNSCLLNFYHDGEDGMGWHSDDERELDSQSPIASLSLGATRKFAFKHKQDKTTCTLSLENGSALVMHPPTQEFWKHALLKTKTIHSPRINLTFRKMKLHHA